MLKLHHIFIRSYILVRDAVFFSYDDLRKQYIHAGSLQLCDRVVAKLENLSFYAKKIILLILNHAFLRMLQLWIKHSIPWQIW